MNIDKLFEIGCNIIKPKLDDISKKTTHDFFKEVKFDGGGIDVDDIVVAISSDYNYNIEFEIRFVKESNTVKSRVFHRLKEWEFPIDDVEQIVGFENQLQTFKKIEKIVIEAFKK